MRSLNYTKNPTFCEFSCINKNATLESIGAVDFAKAIAYHHLNYCSAKDGKFQFLIPDAGVNVRNSV